MKLFVLFAIVTTLAAQTPALERIVSYRMVDLVIGDGPEAKPGQRYRVHYTGTLRDGTKFDSSRDRQEPFTFVQGRRLVIAGWEMGFEGMRVGGRRKLYIPYALAYGEKGQGAIPPKADLIFDVELLGVEDVPATPAGQDVLQLIQEYETKILALAESMPEEKWNWRPQEKVRSFAEVLRHAAYENRLLAALARQSPPRDELQRRLAESARQEQTPLGKTETIALLKSSGAEVREQLTALRAGALARDIIFFEQATTVRGVYMAIATHLAEHLGQLIAYTRMAGLSPPWSK